MRSKTGTRPSFNSSNALAKMRPRPVFKDISNSKFFEQIAIGTSSFAQDADSTGIRSSQELPIDYTKFENHTFFNSARSKVDISFDSVINGFPFDKKRSDIESFLSNLTGFERFVYDQFPKNVGYLNFVGSTSPTFAGGTYISVRDGKSFNFPTLNTTDYGTPVLDLETSPVSFECHLFVPEIVNDNQIVAQRLSTTAGITLAISESASTTDCNVVFLISSASESYVVASGSIQKGQWVHMTAQTDLIDGAKRASIYLNGKLRYISDDTQDFGSLSFEGNNLYIGTGSSHTILDYQFTPTNTFSGSLDEFRMFKSTRSLDEINDFSKREIYAANDLVAYFRFNEPSGSYSGNDVVLDYSGNKLHSYIYNFNSNLRNTSSNPQPITYENVNYSPVLFADFDEIITLNENLLEDAKSFDKVNPNFIINLIPPHYLDIGAATDGLSSIDQNLGVPYTAISIPGTGFLRKPQLMIVFLLAYAKFYDELKLMLDYFVHTNYVELEDPESAIDKFLPYVAQHFGLKLPDFFSNTTPDQFFYGQTLGDDYSYAKKSLQQVKFQIWRRVLGNVTELIQSKGTRSSLRSALLATGIIPENFFNIREFGGPSVVDLKNLRQKTQEKSPLADFSGSFDKSSALITPQGYYTDIPHGYTTYLSSSRVEPGIPQIAGSFSSTGVSDDPNDGLLTSGSFTVEGIVKFPPRTSHATTQSLIRLNITGSSLPSLSGSCIFNVVFDNSQQALTFYARPSKEMSAPTLSLSIPGIDMFNGEKWYFNAGRIRGDLTSSLSSSYFLRCGFVEDNTTYKYFTTCSFFSETLSGVSSDDMFQTLDANYNTSGSFITVGSQSLDNSTGLFLNSVAGITNFDGRIGRLRFWSKDLNENESLEHLRNYRSLGVEDPRFNFNFDEQSSGSFERLRVDVAMDQGTTGSDLSGNIRFFDFSQNNFHLEGSGFEISKNILKNELFQINRISPNIDLLQTDDKVRVRSLLDPTKLDSITSLAPLYQLGPDLAVNDDNRLSIEYSSYKAVNEDMIGLFGDTQFLDNALGQTAGLFDEVYPDLEKVSKVYFERLTGPIDTSRFRELFKWFDSSLTDLVVQMLPRKTRFLGINYVIESHVLERNKYRYPINKMYLLSERPRNNYDLLLTALTAILKRY